MKQIMRDVCVAALGINATLFVLGTMWGAADIMWLAIGSGLLCLLGLKLQQNKEE